MTSDSTSSHLSFFNGCSSLPYEKFVCQVLRRISLLLVGLFLCNMSLVLLFFLYLSYEFIIGCSRSVAYQFTICCSNYLPFEFIIRCSSSLACFCVIGFFLLLVFTLIHPMLTHIPF